MSTPAIPGLERAFPICTPGASDTASFDECLELLHLAGRPIWHAVLMMIPEAWENHATMAADKRAFFRYHSSLMEPWDGPASITFTDGTVIGAVLDRNGLRPSRYWVTDDDRVIMASEAGVVDVDPARVVRKGRLQPGRMFLIDTAKGRIVDDEEIKHELATEHPYGEWLDKGLVHLHDLPDRVHVQYSHESVLRRQETFGYTTEELKILIAPMARTGAEAIGSMGTDTPIAVLSDRSRLLFDYFAQLFAQVTNPPLDAIREELVTSLSSTIGPEANVLEPTAQSCVQVELPFPIIDNDELAKIIHIDRDGDRPEFSAHLISGLYQVAGGGAALREALDRVRHEASAAIAEGKRILVLSDRDSNAEWAPIPSLLLTAAVHHHLIREKTRTKVGLVVEAGDAREVHHMALLIGYGAGAINPYLAFESVEDLISAGLHGLGEMEPEAGDQELHQGRGQGRAQGDVEDGHLHRRVVLRRAGVRGDRPRPGARRRVLHRHGVAPRRHRPRRDRRGSGAPSRHRVPRPSGGARAPRARVRRRVPVAPRGRVPPLQPRDGVQAAARDACEALRHLQGVHAARRRPVAQARHAARPVRLQGRRARAGAARRGRARERDREALRDRRDVVRLHLAGGARDPRHRDEPHRRQVEHR